MDNTQQPCDSHFMQCMEIWGGYTETEERVTTPGLDAWVFCAPFQSEATGGDVHFVSLCGGGVITRIVVADVSGHGEAVSGFSHALRLLVRRNINRKSQLRLVRELNRQFAEHAEFSRFATAVVATYLASNDSLTLSNAGHPRPLWYRAAAEQWCVLANEAATQSGLSNIPLGLDDETSYNLMTVSLGRGDLVLFYTDSLIEAADASGRQLGEEALVDLVRGMGADVEDPAAVGRALLDAVARHREGVPAEDDVTLLVLRHNANPTPGMSLGQKLNVYAKYFGFKDF